MTRYKIAPVALLCVLAGLSVHSASATVVFNDADVGSTPVSGYGYYDASSGQTVVAGAGYDFNFNNSNTMAGNLAYTALTGNFTLSTEITNVSGSNPGSFGLMVLNGQAGQPLSTYGLLFGTDVYPEVSLVSNPNAYQIRTVVGATPAKNSSVVGQTYVPGPYWLQISRNGNTFNSYYSSDGSSWNLMASETLAMYNTVEAGLFTTNANITSSPTVGTYTNTLVNGESAVGPAPQSTSSGNGSTAVPAPSVLGLLAFSSLLGLKARGIKAEKDC